MKPILLTADGTLPNGLTPVMPTPRPVTEPGWRAVETTPELVNGLHHQRWRIEAEEPPPPPPPADPKLVGIEFEGVMCSATSQDQSGLVAVLLAVQMQGAAFQPTRFYFENGTELVLHLGNFQAFTSVWMPFRQSFFLP